MSSRITAIGFALFAVSLVACSDDPATAPTSELPDLAISASRTSTCPSVPEGTSRITLSPSTATVTVGESVTLTAVNQSGRSISACALNWTSSNAMIASVSVAGVVVGRTAGGRVTITAKTTKGKILSATALVSVVSPPVATVVVSPAPLTLALGESQQLTATLRDAKGVVLSGRAVIWTSSSPAVASVNSRGFVTALGLGSATITAMAEGKFGVSAITVKTVFPTNGLIAYLPFRGTTLDSTANHNDYINQGGEFTTDRFGAALSAIRFPHLGDQLWREWPEFPTSAFTVSLWFKIEGQYDYNRFSFFEWGDAGIGSVGKGITMGIDADSMNTGCSSAAGSYRIEAFVGPTQNYTVWGLCGTYALVSQWSHMVLTASAGSGAVYMNGQLTQTFSYSTPMPTASQTSWVGNLNNSNPGLTTRYIDELAVWNRALSPQEVATVFNAGK